MTAIDQTKACTCHPICTCPPRGNTCGCGPNCACGESGTSAAGTAAACMCA